MAGNIRKHKQEDLSDVKIAREMMQYSEVDGLGGRSIRMDDGLDSTSWKLDAMRCGGNGGGGGVETIVVLLWALSARALSSLIIGETTRQGRPDEGFSRSAGSEKAALRRRITRKSIIFSEPPKTPCYQMTKTFLP